MGEWDYNPEDVAFYSRLLQLRYDELAAWKQRRDDLWMREKRGEPVSPEEFKLAEEMTRLTEETIELLRGRLEELKPRVMKLENRWARQLEELRWTPFRDGGGEWCFAETAPIDFVARLREEGRLRLGGYEYSLSRGRDREFLRRRPVQEG